MRIRFLHFEECPNSGKALDLLKLALRVEGLSASVEMVEVTDGGAAEREGFLGSPSIQIEGIDIEVSRANDASCFGCRVYRTEAGASGIPPMEMIRAALRAARTHNSEES